MNAQIPYIVITGPTASGKTRLAVALALHVGGEIINADSMQIYRELNIGASKPTAEQMRGVPHHLLSIVSVGESFSVADYKERALRCIREISLRGKMPIVCGGTGLYINALTGRLHFTTTKGDPALRAELALYAKTKGNQALHERLRWADPVAAARLHPNDLKRVIRALEVCLLTGGKYSEQAKSFTSNAYATVPACMIGLRWERKELEGRIRERVDSMMAQGLLEEARAVYDTGVSPDHPSMKGLGYRQLFEHFNGNCTLEEAVERIKVDTRRYAKRQMTWFSRDLRIHWFGMHAGVEPHTLLQAVCAQCALGPL